MSRENAKCVGRYLGRELELLKRLPVIAFGQKAQRRASLAMRDASKSDQGVGCKSPGVPPQRGPCFLGFTLQLGRGP